MRMSQLGYRKREPVEIPREEPMLLRRIIDFHRSQHGYSLSQLSEAANLTPNEFQDVYLSDEPPRLRLVP